MSQNVTIISCHDCGLLQQIIHMPEEGTIKCCRCQATLRQRQRIDPAKSIEHTLALVIAAVILLTIANLFPIVQIHVEGHDIAITLYACVYYLLTHGMILLGGLVFFTSIFAPVMQLMGLLYILLPVHFKHRAPFSPHIYRFVRLLTSWSMLEVLVLGVFVSVVKLSAMATVVPSISLGAFGLLILCMAGILTDLDTEMLWERISPQNECQELISVKTGRQLINCHNCHLLCSISEEEHTLSFCLRCSSAIHLRKPESLARSTALLLSAFIMYIPANIMPVMIVTSLGKAEGDTIMGGVIHLAAFGDLPLAIILFIASILVPSVKLMILTLLLFTVRFKAHWRPVERTQLYRLTEVIGRWSMVDIFVVTLMAALIQIQGLMVIEVGFGALAFGAVIVLTMLSAMAFDPRLIWDNMEQVYE